MVHLHLQKGLLLLLLLPLLLLSLGLGPLLLGLRWNPHIQRLKSLNSLSLGTTASLPHVSKCVQSCIFILLVILLPKSWRLLVHLVQPLHVNTCIRLLIILQQPSITKPTDIISSILYTLSSSIIIATNATSTSSHKLLKPISSLSLDVSAWLFVKVY